MAKTRMGRHRIAHVIAAVVLATAWAACDSDATKSSREQGPTPPDSTAAETFSTKEPRTSGSVPTLDVSKLNEWDRELVGQLRQIGIDDARPVEHGFRGSNVAGHDQGRYVAVSTNEQDIEYDADIVRTTSIRGVDVRVMHFIRSSQALHFECADLHYDLRAFDRPDSGTVNIPATQDLAERLIVSLNCS